MYNNVVNSKNWNKEEDLKLIKYIEENKSYDDIGIEFKRSIGNIRSRVLDKIIFMEYNSINVNELAKKYKYNNIENLRKCLDNKKNISEERLITENKNRNKSRNHKCNELLINIIDRLEKIEYNIDLYCSNNKNLR